VQTQYPHPDPALAAAVAGLLADTAPHRADLARRIKEITRLGERLPEERRKRAVFHACLAAAREIPGKEGLNAALHRD